MIAVAQLMMNMGRFRHFEDKHRTVTGVFKDGSSVYLFSVWYQSTN